jgi:hypothetical protein
MKRELQPITSNLMFRWPEFVALANRLGIDLDQRITALKIEFTGPDTLVNITVTHQALDTTQLADPPAAIETTNVHNEQYKTYMVNPRVKER